MGSKSNPPNHSFHPVLWGLVAWILSLAAAHAVPPTAELQVTGYGFFGNRNLKKSLTLLQTPGGPAESFSANFVEDGVLILMSQLNRDGYLKPMVRAVVTRTDSQVEEYEWTKPVADQPLPRPLEAKKVEFQINEGVLYYFRTIQFQGSLPISDRQAQGYFVEAGGLLSLKQTRVYSISRLQHGLSSLVEVLNRRGFESGLAEVTSQNIDDHSGAVDLTIRIAPGPRSLVRTIRQEYFSEGADKPGRVSVSQTNAPYSRVWVQDFAQQLRATNFHLGYPDTHVEISQTHRETVGPLVYIDLLAQVRSGPRIQLREVHFEGQKKTKLRVMERRARLEEGENLDRIEVEGARFRLSRLGVFNSVDLSYSNIDEHTRDVTYQVTEGKRIDFSLLAGFGSYELLRGGLELNQNNVLGRAHHARLRLIQSFKASYGEYLYTMPEFVGRDLDVFFNGSALRREEIDFTREEFGGGFGVSKFVSTLESDVRVRYHYEVLNAAAAELTGEEGLTSANVGAFVGEIRHDRQDNPLYPRRGYKIFGTLELASDYLAGDVNYQRFELNTAYHQPLDSGRWLHLGLSHGAVFTLGSPAEDLPFNRRFFPGGDTSIRGYQQGEAAPRNARGKLVGAESYLFGSVEFEQALTTAWSAVAFLDTVSFAQHLHDYPFNETLFSVGGGLRWRTLLGPIRLEYGYNLNRRERDPVGTIQVSVGFPF